MQLAATAGHFHPEDFAFLSGGKADVTGSIGASGTPAPQGGQPTLPTHDDCSLCFSLQLAGNSTLPVPVVLAPPDAHAAAPPARVEKLPLTAAAHLLFQTRAPPIA